MFGQTTMVFVLYMRKLYLRKPIFLSPVNRGTAPNRQKRKHLPIELYPLFNLNKVRGKPFQINSPVVVPGARHVLTPPGYYPILQPMLTVAPDIALYHGYGPRFGKIVNLKKLQGFLVPEELRL